MSHLPIPLAVVYAGLAGTLLALLVAAATNRWSVRVFFLLALRLAIGWHFMFEGMHKIHSHNVGPVEVDGKTQRPFSSEPYFRVAPGPLGEQMRKQFSDPAVEIAQKVKAPKPIGRSDFGRLSADEQAAACPEAVAKQLDGLKATFVETMKADAAKEEKNADDALAKALKETDAEEQRALTGAWTENEKDAVLAKHREARRKAEATAAARIAAARERLEAARRFAPLLLAAAPASTPKSAEPPPADGGWFSRLYSVPPARGAADQSPKELIESLLKAVGAQAEQDIKAAKATEEKALAAGEAAERKALKGAETDAEKAKVRADAESKRQALRTTAELAKQAAAKKAEEAEDRVEKALRDAKASYARWVYGVDARPATVKFTSGDVALSGSQRLDHVEWLKAEARAAEARQADGLGNGTGTDSKRVADFRMAAVTAEADLARDANSFIADLKKELNGGKVVEETAKPSRGQQMDKVTMWFLVAVGACLMFGLFTRLACVLACGFLVMTYLAHPAFPWYPLPPNTEGNPVFVNKNVIEALALLALACYPTGRWLGLDALVLRPFRRYRRDAA